MTARKPQEGTTLIPSNLHVPEDCRAVTEILARIGDKWTVLVVGELGGGPKRFSEIRRALGSISQRMLTLTLRGLERDGLVTRTRVPLHSAARRLRTDKTWTIVAQAGERTGPVGQAEPRGHCRRTASIRCG